MKKIKKNDLVKVMVGKDKGREGVVEIVLPSLKKVIIPEINMYKKHVKGFEGQKGGVYSLPRALDISKVMLICPSCKKTTRVGLKLVEKRWERFCKKCKKQIVKTDIVTKTKKKK